MTFLDENDSIQNQPRKKIQQIHVGVSKNRGTPNGWFIMENPIKMDDMGVPLFSETSMWNSSEKLHFLCIEGGLFVVTTKVYLKILWWDFFTEKTNECVPSLKEQTIRRRSSWISLLPAQSLSSKPVHSPFCFFSTTRVTTSTTHDLKI